MLESLNIFNKEPSHLQINITSYVFLIEMILGYILKYIAKVKEKQLYLSVTLLGEQNGSSISLHCHSMQSHTQITHWR